MDQIPDGKLNAVNFDQKLKDTIAQLLEFGLAGLPETKVPLRVPQPVPLKRQGLVTIKDIESAIAAGRV